MNLDDARVVPAPGGSGLACRFDGVVLYCADRPSDEAIADLVGRCRRAAQVPEPGTVLVRQLAGLIAAADRLEVPTFALVARTSGGLAVLASGPVDVDIEAEGSTETLSGTSSITCVDRVITGPCERLAVHGIGAPEAEAASEVDLVAGVVPAGGLVLETRSSAAAPPPSPDPGGSAELTGEPTQESSVDGPAPVTAPPPLQGSARPAAPSPPPPPDSGPPPPPAATPPPPPPPAAPAPPPPPPPAAAPPGSPAPAPPASSPAPPPAASGPAPPPDCSPGGFDFVLLNAPEVAEDASAEPLPVEPDPSDVREAESKAGPVHVRGTVCSRGHFNDPRSRFCSSCGISMVHQTLNLVTGARPPLGVLVFEDGTTYSLSSDYVVGRQPDRSPLVESGEALPLALHDEARTISRVHAELRLEGWDVYFVHRSGTNGSFLLDSKTGQWTPLAAGNPVQLASGARVAMGGRVAVFESALVR